MFPDRFFLGKWIGQFIYGPEYSDIEGEKVSFMLFIEKNDETGFLGKAIDIAGVGVNKDVASIRGFIEDGIISFVKQYPIKQFFQEDGTIEIRENKPSPEIHYTGEYSEQQKNFIGVWEVEWGEVNENGGFSEYLSTGTWEMRKAED